MSDGPRSDLCQVNEGSTLFSFSPTTGEIEFSSYDIVNFPPGVYTIKVTGTAGTISVSHQFDLTLVDPCPTATLTLKPSPFTD